MRVSLFSRRLRILNQQLEERERAERQARPVDCNLECKNIISSFKSDFIKMEMLQQHDYHFEYFFLLLDEKVVMF